MFVDWIETGFFGGVRKDSPPPHPKDWFVVVSASYFDDCRLSSFVAVAGTQARAMDTLSQYA